MASGNHARVPQKASGRGRRRGVAALDEGAAVLIAGPNPSVDRVLELDEFAPGGIHRAVSVQTCIGGGGVNAARTVSRLDESAVLVLILPRVDEEIVVGDLQLPGVEMRRVPCAGTTRVGTILRERGGRLSGLTEPGVKIGAKEWEEFRRLIFMGLSSNEVLLCTGSIPPGAPPDGYARFAREARHLGARCVVDASGETLAATIEAGEAVVVPNLAEAETLLSGRRPEKVNPTDAPERAREAADGLLRQGAHIAVVTAGSAGVAVATGGPFGSTDWFPSPTVEAANPIGAGDAFAAALALQLEAGTLLDEAVRFAVTTAAAHVCSLSAISPLTVGAPANDL